MQEFNPNELVLEKVRHIETYDPATDELIGRYTQIEDPSLKTSADASEVTDAMGSPIATFYKAQKGEFTFTNSLFSLDLAASQFGSKKQVASTSDKIIVPVSETIKIGDGGKVVLKYTPVGTNKAEVKYVKVINENNTFGKTYEVSATAGDGKFTIDATTKTITMPADVTGRVFVKYERETDKAVKITKNTDGVPDVVKLIIYALFHDTCNQNLMYAGAIECPRAQLDPSSVELSLKSDGKHAATYKLQKPYCDEDSALFNIIVTED